jgi:hypothetical protein
MCLDSRVFTDFINIITGDKKIVCYAHMFKRNPSR